MTDNLTKVMRQGETGTQTAYSMFFKKLNPHLKTLKTVYPDLYTQLNWIKERAHAKYEVGK